MSKTLYLCGAGNSEGVRLALRINEAESRWDKIVLLDDDPLKLGSSKLGVRVEGPFDLLADADPASDEVQNLVARTCKGRQSAHEKIAEFQIPFATLISPAVDTGGMDHPPHVIAYHNVTLGPESTLGESSVVFMGAIVGHECNVGRGCVIAGNAVLNARVELEEYVYVGANATVLPEIRIGAGATVGAGSVVIQDVPAGATVFGVPAQVVNLIDTGPEDDLETPTHEDPEATPGSFMSVTEIEQTVTSIWMEEIGLDEVGLEDNFFDVGGCSLYAIRVHDRINRQTRSAISIADVFRFPTIRSMAEYIGRPPSELTAVRSGESRGSLRRRRSNRRPA